MKYFFSIVLLASCLSTNAQTEQKAWFTDQSDAMVYATEHGAQILMVFAGSDWCRPCIQFKKDILESTEFNSFAEDNLVVLYLDFPSKRKNKLSKEATAHNEALAEKYNQSGTFPKIILLDNEMNKIKDLKYTGQSRTDFLASIK